MSQRELARRAGVTNGLISLIEQNRVSPSVSSLKKVLDGVPMSLAEFFTLDLSATPQLFSAPTIWWSWATTKSPCGWCRAAPRAAADAAARALRGRRGTGEEMLAHRGEEAGVVIRGRIELTVGGAARVLGPGEAYYFASRLPHRFRNVGREACEIYQRPAPHRPSEGSPQS